MKTLLLLASALALSPLAANAGNMFGPGPFRSGSPLVSGVDGTYQATARAENVTGIFRFAYSGGSQTANARQNNWIFFINGQVMRGNVEAAINTSSIDGILDSESSGMQLDSNGVITLPMYFFSGANAAAGNFRGQLNLKSPSGAFNGTGELLPTPPSTNELTAISREAFTTTNGSTFFGPIESTNVAWTNSGGTIDRLSFKFRGVRTSTSASTISSNGITTSN
jgi:hypothetical protein